MIGKIFEKHINVTDRRERWRYKGGALIFDDLRIALKEPNLICYTIVRFENVTKNLVVGGRSGVFMATLDYGKTYSPKILPLKKQSLIFRIEAPKSLSV